MVAEYSIAVVDGAGLERIGKSPCRSCHADPDNRGTEETTQHHLAATDLLDEMGTKYGKGELKAAVTESDVGLANGVVDTSSVEDGSQEVGERSITAP